MYVKNTSHLKETTSVTWIQRRLLAKGIKPEDNEPYKILSGWFLWSNPQLNRSVQHQTKCVSSPHPSVHHTKASVQHIKPSVQHIKSVSVLNWCFFCVKLTVFCGELTLFSCETDGFLWWTEIFSFETEGFSGQRKSGPFALNWRVELRGILLSDDSYDMNSSNWDIIQFH